MKTGKFSVVGTAVRPSTASAPPSSSSHASSSSSSSAAQPSSLSAAANRRVVPVQSTRVKRTRPDSSDANTTSSVSSTTTPVPSSATPVPAAVPVQTQSSPPSSDSAALLQPAVDPEAIRSATAGVASTLAAASVPSTRPTADFRPFPQGFQDVSSSQVGSAVAKIADNVMRFVRVNARDDDLRMSTTSGVSLSASANSFASSMMSTAPLYTSSPIHRSGRHATSTTLDTSVKIAPSYSVYSSTSSNAEKAVARQSLHEQLQTRLAAIVVKHWKNFTRKNILRRYLFAWHAYVWSHKHDYKLNVLAATKSRLHRLQTFFAAWRDFVRMQRQITLNAAKECLRAWLWYAKRERRARAHAEKRGEKSLARLVRTSFLFWRTTMHNRRKICLDRAFRSWRRHVLVSKENLRDLALTILERWKEWASREAKLHAFSQSIAEMADVKVMATCWQRWKRAHKVKLLSVSSTLRRAWVEWSTRLRWKRDMRMAVKTYCVALLQRAWRVWRKSQMRRLLQRDYEGTLRADVFFNYLLRRRGIRAFTSNLEYQKRKRSLNNKAVQHAYKAILRRTLRSWLDFRRVQNEEEFKEKVANDLYQRTLKGHVFNAWWEFTKEESIRQLKLRQVLRRMHLKRLSAALNTWKWYALVHRPRSKSDNITAILFYSRTVFAKWKQAYMYLEQARNFRSRHLLKKALDAWYRSREDGRVRVAFLHWLEYHKQAAIEKLQIARAETHFCNQLRSRAFRHLLQYAIFRRSKSAQYRAMDAFSARALMREAYLWWKQSADDNVALRRSMYAAAQFDKEHTERRALRRVKMYATYRKTKARLEHEAHTEYTAHMLKAGVSHWMAVASDLRAKRADTAAKMYAFRAQRVFRRVEHIARHWRQWALLRKASRMTLSETSGNEPRFVSSAAGGHVLKHAASSDYPTVSYPTFRSAEPEASLLAPKHLRRPRTEPLNQTPDVGTERDALRSNDYEFILKTEQRRKERQQPKNFDELQPTYTPAQASFESADNTPRYPQDVVSPIPASQDLPAESVSKRERPMLPPPTAQAVQQKSPHTGYPSSESQIAVSPGSSAAPQVQPSRHHSPTRDAQIEALHAVIDESKHMRREFEAAMQRMAEREEAMARERAEAERRAMETRERLRKEAEAEEQRRRRRMAEDRRRRDNAPQPLKPAAVPAPDAEEDRQMAEVLRSADVEAMQEVLMRVNERREKYVADKERYETLIDRRRRAMAEDLSDTEISALWSEEDEAKLKRLKTRIRDYKEWKRRKEPYLRDIVAMAHAHGVS